jgi:hypothetical protein
MQQDGPCALLPVGYLRTHPRSDNRRRLPLVPDDRTGRRRVSSTEIGGGVGDSPERTGTIHLQSSSHPACLSMDFMSFPIHIDINLQVYFRRVF